MKKIPFLFLLSIYCIDSNAQDTLTIDTTIHYQTITGWGHGGGVLGHCSGPFYLLDSSVADPVNYQTLDYLTDDLGLTGSRTWEVGPRTDGTGMDNGDCDSINWNKFEESLPTKMADYLIYFKNKIIAQGFQPNFYSSPGYPTHASDLKPWIMYHPGERAQQIWASSLYMKNTFGIDINYDVIYNEPSGNITPNILAEDIKALTPRMSLHGLSTRSQFPEAIAPITAWNNFIMPLQNDSELWTNVGRISYHNYGTADPYRSMISTFAESKGITTAQTEMGNPTFDELYSDLTLGNVSYWEVAYAGSNTLVPDSGITSFVPSSTYFRMRQLLHYVRPGAIRVKTISNDTLLHVLAFIQNNFVTTVIENLSGSTKNVFISGLQGGNYAISRSAAGAGAFQEMGLQTLTGDTITISAAGGGSITTLYPYSLPDHAPTIMTFKSVPGYVVSPSSIATLSATANDAELETLAYQWSVMSSPVGTNPVIANPSNNSTVVNGLTLPGTYVFNIDASDGINTSSKKVFLIVYSTEPSPVLGSCGFRINTPYGLVFANPGDTTHANIELPLTSVVLQAGISSVANTGFAGQGTWSLISQPAGANAVVDSTIYIYVSLRANATNMTVPGDYVFQINVTNSGHPDLIQQIICTVHPASSPPVINSITPNPNVISLPASSTLLTAVTSDPDSDLLRHWWSVVSAPPGAQVQFDYQCKPVTNVSGLTIPGTYTFQLRVFDDLHMVMQNVSVIVNGTTGVEAIKENNSIDFLYPNPFNNELYIKIAKDEMTELFIYDVFGNIILRKIFSHSDLINAENISSGIYFYELKNKFNLINKGIIIKN